MLSSTKRKYRSYLVDNKFLLTGLLKHNCGYSSNGKRNSTGYTFYRCRDCSKSIPAKKVEAAVIKDFKRHCASLEQLKKTKPERGKDKASSKIYTLNNKRQRIVESYMDGNLNRDYYLKLIDEVDKEIKALKNEKESKKEDMDTILNNNYELLMGLVSSFDEKNIIEQNRILKLFIEAVIYVNKETELEIIYKF